ncbi:unnamed protein product [Orchesella dallaii]|uniref:Odorant receptor n=1 Tax=Orchesella dallaii TaxID=48710 RepID=A0ABP1PS93_9HEXA
MWEVLQKIQTGLQRIRPFTVEYSKKKSKFIEKITLQTKIVSILIDSNVILCLFATFYGLKLLLSEADKNKKSSDNLQNILNSVLHILYLGLYSLMLAASWTMWKRSKETLWMISMGKNFYEKRERLIKRVVKKKGKKTFTVFDFLLCGMVVIVLFGASTAGLLPILTNKTPGHIIFGFIVPQSFIKEQSGWLTGLCVVYLGGVAGLAALPIMQILIFMCATLCESQLILRPGYGVSSVWKRLDFHRARLLYTQAVLFIRAYNSFGYVYFPLVIMTGFTINVTTTFVCLKFYKDLAPMLLLVIAGFDIACVFVTAAIHSFAMMGAEEGDKFCGFWKGNLIKKIERKQFRACYPIRVEVGPYFALQRTTLLNTISEVVNGTVTLLIAEK